MIFNMAGGGRSTGGLPEFTYTGDYNLIDDGDKNWQIKFLTSGTLTFTKAPGTIDAFCVGGGGGGGLTAGGGGGGGYTSTALSIVVQAATRYSVIVGAGGSGAPNYDSDGGTGGKTSAFGVTATGGKGGKSLNSTPQREGGDGGSGGGGGGYGTAKGGAGGSDGSDGGNNGLANGCYAGGLGQRSTTRAFGESTGDLYAGGGAGGTKDLTGTAGLGGSGGGGDPDMPGEANTGGGGGGRYENTNALAGGSGIVIIRNHRG